MARMPDKDERMSYRVTVDTESGTSRMFAMPGKQADYEIGVFRSRQAAAGRLRTRQPAA